MAFINEHYLKLSAGYLFPEIARRVNAYREANPIDAENIIHCGVGDVTEAIPAVAAKAIKHAADELSSPDTFRGYPPATGYDFIRRAIAENEFRSQGIEISDDEIFFSDGSKGDCGHILEILGQGNVIAVTDPVYPVYVDTNVMIGNTGHALDEGGYEGIITLPGTEENGFISNPPDQHADIAYLCFPNNPTGSMINHDQLKAWVDWALEHDALILYDTAYVEFIRDDTLPRSIYEIPGAEKCAIEFHSFSKNAGFTGIRAGFTVFPKSITASTRDGRRIQLHDLWSRRWSTRSNGVSWPVHRAVESLYTDEGKAQIKSLVDHYMGNARLLLEACTGMGMTVFGGENAPYVWVKCPVGADSWQMFDRILQEIQVVITPGAGFGRSGEGYFRISAFNSRENVVEVSRRMQILIPA